MGRPYEGRTQTVVQRSTKVLFDSIKEKETWQRKAKDAGRKLSPYLLEMAARGEEQRPSSRHQEQEETLKARLTSLQEELTDAKERHRWDQKLLRLQEQELRELRRRPPVVLRPGRHRFSTQVLNLLRQHPAIQDRDLWRALSISASSPEAAEVTRQLELLERGAVVERTSNGWRLLLRDPET